jgi:DNA-binding MarR family transcriptional regulator
MKLFDQGMKEGSSPDACAAALLEGIPLVMQAIRAEIRQHRPTDLSIQQFRALAFVRRNAGSSLSEVAEHVGLSLPAMSSLIERLVGRDLVLRELDSKDRRRVTLSLSEAGDKAVQDARAVTRDRLAEVLTQLPQPQRESIVVAMRALYLLFSAAPGGR